MRGGRWARTRRSGAFAAASLWAVNILIAEHSRPVRAALKALVDRTGRFTVQLATDAAEAIGCCRRAPPDAALVSLGLPGGVLGVLGEVRRSSPHVLLIVLASHTAVAARAACREAGADHVLDKHDEFDEAVRLVVRESQRRRRRSPPRRRSRTRRKPAP